MGEPNKTTRKKLQACRICLNTDIVVTQLGHSGMTSFLENIFKNNGYNQHITVLHYVCLECKGLLWKSYSFVQRALKAQKKMYELMAGKNALSAKELLSIDRRALGICTSLGYHRVKVNFKYIENQNDTPIFPSNDENIVKIEFDSAHKKRTDSSNEEDPIQINNNEKVSIEINIKNEPIGDNEYQDSIQVTEDIMEVNTDEMMETENVEVSEYLGLEDFEMNEYLPKSDIIISDDTDVIEIRPLKNRKIKKKKKRVVGKRKIVRKDNTVKVYKKSIRPKGVKISTDNIITEPRNRKLKMTSYKDIDCEEKIIKYVKKCHKDQKPPEDCDYVPQNESSSDSETTSHDSFDDNGKRMKKPKDTRDYPRECDHCNFTVEKRADHYRHYLTSHQDIEYPYHVPAIHVCQYCGKKYRHEKYLQRHELTHFDERSFECEVCGKTFKNCIRLYRHKYRHKAPTMFCDYCKKGFSERYEMIKHIRMHTGEKPFKCPHCDATFSLKGNIKSHIKAHHHFVDPAKNINKKKKEST